MIPAIDAELAWHADKLDMKLQSLCGNGFSLFAVRILAKPYHLERIDQKFAKTKMGYIPLPSNLNGIIGITSYYCVILKIMILHDTIKNKVFPFSLKTEQSLVSLKKNLLIIQ